MNFIPPQTLPLKPTANVLRIALTADVHLRNSVSGSTLLGRDFFIAAQSVLQKSQDRGCRVLLNAGDFLDTPNLLAQVWDQVVDLDAMAKHMGLPVLTITGNHDNTDPPWVSTIPSDDRTFTLRPGLLDANNQIVDVGGLRIACWPFMDAVTLRKRIANTTPGSFDVLVWHGAVKEWAGFPAEGMIEAADFAPLCLKAVLLGDIHITKFLYMQNADNTPCLIGYPGATETAKSDDPLDHFFAVIDFDVETRNVLGLELVRTDHRHVITLNIPSQASLDAAVVRVKKAADEHLGRILVLCDCAESVKGTSNALREAAGLSAVVRVTPYPDAIPLNMTFMSTTSDDTEAPVMSLADRFYAALPHNTGMASLLVQLLDPAAPAPEMIRTYAQRRLDEIQRANP